MGIPVTLKNVQTWSLFCFKRTDDTVGDDGQVRKGKFQVAVRIAPDDKKNMAKIEKGVREALMERMQDEKAVERFMSSRYGFGHHDDKCAVRDLAMRDNPYEDEDMQEGLYFYAKSNKQPEIYTSDKEMQTEPGFTVDGNRIEGEEVYSGCIANVAIDIYYMEKFKNLCIGFEGIKYVDEGKKFGGGGKMDAKTKAALLDDDDDDAPAKPKRSLKRRVEDDE